MCNSGTRPYVNIPAPAFHVGNPEKCSNTVATNQSIAGYSWTIYIFFYLLSGRIHCKWSSCQSHMWGISWDYVQFNSYLLHVSRTFFVNCWSCDCNNV